MNDTLLEITAGLPYNRRIRVKDGVNVWSSVEEFEVRSHVRVSPNQTSTLKATLSTFITPSIDGNDVVLDLKLTGSESRALLGGFYDIVISDKGSTDARALRVLKGQLRVSPLVTGA